MLRIKFVVVILPILVLATLSVASLSAKEAVAVLGDGTRIEADSAANVIRFYIDGRETARLDATGLHVREDMNNGGVTRDYGQAGFDAHTGAGGADVE